MAKRKSSRRASNGSTNAGRTATTSGRAKASSRNGASRAGGSSNRSRAGVGARRRRRYTAAQRERVLETARREGLTAADVNRRFGVSAVTYYLWRKQARPAIRQAVRQLRETRLLDVADEIRDEVRNQIRSLIPEIVRTELDGVWSDVTGKRSRTRGRSRRSQAART